MLFGEKIMKLSEIKIATTVAIMQSATTKDEVKSFTVSEDVERQCEIVGQYMGKAFLMECINNAENCLDDSKKFTEIMKQFKEIGARFSENVEFD
tara:strand:+ start:224 stop:508 length:285 start_codon:yes stop_codon:yes gene_type:complete